MVTSETVIVDVFAAEVVVVQAFPDYQLCRMFVVQTETIAELVVVFL